MNRKRKYVMLHKSVRKKCLRYLDKELSEREWLKIRRHLEICKTCRDDYKYVESMWRIDVPVERIKAPPFLWTRILTIIHSDEKQGLQGNKKRTVLPVMRPLMLIMALLAALFGGIR